MIVGMLSHHILFKVLKLDFYHACTHDYASHFLKKKKTDVNASDDILEPFLQNRLDHILNLFPITNRLDNILCLVSKNIY